VIAQVQLWLVEDEPTAGTAPTAAVRTDKLTAQIRRGVYVWRGRTRRHHEVTINNLPDHILR
jgi:hypothetical protein